MWIPDEISNHICSYIEGPNNKIIRNLFSSPIELLKLNRRYNFKHVNIQRLLVAMNTTCPYCLNILTPQEYLHKDLYEIITEKKLCIECLEKEKNRLVFEYSELVLLIIILMAIVRFDILIYIMFEKHLT
jgi:hypothetical protein